MENKNKEEQLMLFKVRDLREKTQYKVDDTYLNGYARVCKPVATAIYNSLCRHAGFHTQKAFPSQSLMAYQHNISVKAVRRAIKKLAEYNIIMIERHREKGKFVNYIYTLLDKSEWKPINQRTKTTYGQPADKNTTRQKTTMVKVPTKDNKVSKDNKYILKDNKEKEKTVSPAEEMRRFLEGKELSFKLAELIIEKTGMPMDKVVRELNNFKGYWSELNKSGTKQRWELERTFQLQRRLSVWFRNAEKFRNGIKLYSKKKNIII